MNKNYGQRQQHYPEGVEQRLEFVISNAFPAEDCCDNVQPLRGWIGVFNDTGAVCDVVVILGY